MLIAVRAVAAAITLVMISIGGVGVAAAAPVIPPKPAGDYRLYCVQGLCVWIATSHVQGKDKTATTGHPPKKATHTKAVCELAGAAQACVDAELGNWSNSRQCYLKREVPSPPPDDPRWEGHTDGSVWACVREQGYDQGKHLVTRWVWLPGEPDTVVVDSVTLAYRAVAAMRLGPPLVRSVPGVGEIGLVNMPVWLWVVKTDNTWGPIERAASVPGLSVTVRAWVVAVDWALGDGQVVRCEGAGTAYTAAMGVKDSPDCGHRYKKTSRKLDNCKYPVTATARWKITWESTLGDTGQLDMTQQASTQLRIGEAVPVLIDPDGGDRVTPAEQAAC
ncbi:hypothetical protein [Kribbella solani]|uniref:hypothetical protein n=1 Tax=Kribbella solani TaxID=236067 RepID=UPI0029A53254|nr:hypothetical protein [Kribbella solani]MDX2974659.1 hypothetical protein [Kribbella solani]